MKNNSEKQNANVSEQREQQRIEGINTQVEILRDIMLNGTDEHKQAIENVINEYSKAQQIREIEIEIEAKKEELRALESSLEELNK